MTRAQIETLVADYLDGILGEADAAEFERCLPLYPDLAGLVRDAKEGMELLGQLEPPPTPPALYARIAFSLDEARRQAEREKRNTGWLLTLATFFAPVLQPRVVMGMAMTILSISMIGQLTGVRVQRISPDDLRPAAIWSSIEYRAQRAWDRATKYYESLRVVYEMRSTVREWRTEIQRERERTPNQSDGLGAESAPDRTGPQSPAKSGGREEPDKTSTR